MKNHCGLVFVPRREGESSVCTSVFGDMFPCKDCPLPGCSQPDSLSHTLACQVLLAAVPEPSAVQYGDVFSDSQEIQNSAILRFSQLVKARTGILEQNV